MDIESQSSQWAKSTQSNIEMFLDDYLIRSPILKVRTSSQKLLFFLFRRGNQQQKLRIVNLLQSRCSQLSSMGRASQNFLGLLKSIFDFSNEYVEHKSRIIAQVFSSLDRIHNKVVNNSQYQFYSFASNLIDFGNEQFKPYLLEANGCLNCFGRSEIRSEPFKFDTCLQTLKIFTNKLEYVFKRVYEVKELTINLRATTRMKSVTVSYVNQNMQYIKIGKFKLKQAIVVPFVTLQGLYFEFELARVKEKPKCIFCDVGDQMNCVCGACAKRIQMVDIQGNFKTIGANQKIISEELCSDYEKIQENIISIKNLHRKILNKQKIVLNFKLDEMVEIYQRIINNVSLLHEKNPSKLKCRETQDCFSCNYYEIINITKFLREIMKRRENLKFEQQDTDSFILVLMNCLLQNKIQSLKTILLQTLAVLIVSQGKNSYHSVFSERMVQSCQVDLAAKVLIALKQKRSTNQVVIDDEMLQIKKYFQSKHIRTVKQRIKIFVCYFLQWEFLLLVLSNTFSHFTQINRLSIQQYNELSFLINFQLSEIFNEDLDTFLKAFLKIIPASKQPCASLQIGDSEFLQYVDKKLPEIQVSTIEQSIIYCPNPMIKLDMFVSLPILISKVSIKQSMKVMNSLFPFRNVWNLNMLKACSEFQLRLSQLPAEQQIYMCLYGYCKSKQYLYIQRLYKLLVPQRLQFIIRLQAPIAQIQINNVEYPYLPIRQVKSEDLQGDTIKALHDWVYAQLVKMNQAMPLDIIVEKNIIDNMDFPIELVYNNIAENKSKRKIGDKEYDFFKVIYRVQGILGQPKQRSIGNLRDQKLQTCISLASHFLNKFSDEFSKKIGLDILIQILESIKPGPESQDKKVLLFEVLSTLSNNEAICKKIVEGQYGDSIINATVRLMSFENQKDAKITNFLLTLSSKVIDQANQQMTNLRKGSVGQYRKMSGSIEIEGGVSESENKVSYVLQKITECEKTYESTGNTLYRDIAKRLIKLLPFCSKDQVQSTRLLFNFFQVQNWSSKPSSKMQNMITFVDSLSQSYMTFKGIVNENGVTNDIIKTITNSIRKQGKEQIEQKKLSINKSTTESALVLLCALIQGDERLQGELFESKVFHNIFEISQIPPKKAHQINAGRVPENCYKIIKYLSEGKIVDSRILNFLQERKRKDKEKVEPKKTKKWDLMKNKQKQALSKKMYDESEDIQKDLIACSSCQQGYNRKNDILGLYIYFTKSDIPLQNIWWKDSRKMASLNSTTYFTAIHFECHMRAYEADQRIPRSEWDGALIRNMDVLCNSWIPFKGPKTTFDQFSRVERKYFQRNKCGNYWNAVSDLQGLIQKLSIEFDFATQSRGSSSSHNCRYIPILIGFCCYQIQKANGCQNIEKGMAYLTENPPRKLEIINLMMCYSLFTMNYQQFQTIKPNYLNWILNSKGSEQEVQFSQIKSHLVYLKVVEQIFEIIHKNIPINESGQANKMYKELDTHLALNLQKIVPEFEALNERYKSKYTKYTSVQQFEL